MSRVLSPVPRTLHVLYDRCLFRGNGRSASNFPLCSLSVVVPFLSTTYVHARTGKSAQDAIQTIDNLPTSSQIIVIETRNVKFSHYTFQFVVHTHNPFLRLSYKLYTHAHTHITRFLFSEDKSARGTNTTLYHNGARIIVRMSNRSACRPVVRSPRKLFRTTRPGVPRAKIVV